MKLEISTFKTVKDVGIFIDDENKEEIEKINNGFP